MLSLFSARYAKLAVHLLLWTTFASAQRGFSGMWKEPTGSVIEIHSCGNDLCLRLVSISSQAPSLHDDRNPDPRLRSRLLCGLEIGRGFQAVANDKAEGGLLYDPKSGKTYKGSMTRVDDELHLRGYVGVKLFGTTETWTKVYSVAPCKVPAS